MLYSTSVRLFTYLNDKLFLRELQILNHDELKKNQKISDEIWRFDWIKLID